MYWAFRTWKHYRDHTGRTAYPFLHALTFLVPIYGLFQVHKHVRVYNGLMEARGLEASIKPVRAVIAFVFAYVYIFGYIFSGMSWIYRWEIGMDIQILGMAVIVPVVFLINVLATAWLLSYIQKDLNRYWQSFPRSGIAPLGKGEFTIVLIGIVHWIDFFSGFAGES